MSGIIWQTVLMMASLKFLGAVFGYLIPTFDAIAYALYLHPERIESTGVKTAWQQKKFRDVLSEARVLLQQPVPFIHRGVVFLGAFFVVSLFVLTSANSWLGTGVLIGFSAYMLLTMLPYRNNIPAMQERFFLGLAKHVTPAALMSLVVVLAAILLFALFA